MTAPDATADVPDEAVWAVLERIPNWADLPCPQGLSLGSTFEQDVRTIFSVLAEAGYEIVRGPVHTKWGSRRNQDDLPLEWENEQDARSYVADPPGLHVVSRQVTEWRPAPDLPRTEPPG